MVYCRLADKFARKGRYVSIHQFGEDMSQCSQSRIGLALRPFCLPFLSALLPRSHEYRHWSAVRRYWKSEWQKTLLTRNFARLTHISAQFRRKTSFLVAKFAKLRIQDFRQGYESIWVSGEYMRQ